MCVANSDAAVIKLCTRWIRQLSKAKLDYGVQYHADQDLDELRRFWGTELGIRPDQVRMQRKSNSNQLAGRTWRSVHGGSPCASATRSFAPGCRVGSTGCARAGSRLATGSGCSSAW